MNTLFLPRACALGLALAYALAATVSYAQKPPSGYSLDLENGTYGIDLDDPNGLFDPGRVDTLAVRIGDGWWDRIQDGPVLGTLDYRGERYDSIELGIKGSSSDFANHTFKKSFALGLDSYIDGQDINGYDETNLHCGIFDPSHVREATFNWIGRHYLPAPKSNFVYLTIDGVNWGAYTNTQEQDKRFLREWFADDSGPRFRGESPHGRIGADDSCVRPSDDDGRAATPSALHYLGRDSAEYANYYSPRGTHEAGDWQHLIDFIDGLNNLPDSLLTDSLTRYLDIDAALWFLAHEILLGDEDGYVYKTQSDYLLYHDPGAQRMVPIEYDGNSSFSPRSVGWSPLHRADDPCLPLVHRLLNHPPFRARYLAHCRTIIDEYLRPEVVLARIDTFASRIDGFERNDPIGDELYDYEDFVEGVADLKDYVLERHAFLTQHPLLQGFDVAIGRPQLANADTSLGAVPVADEPVLVSMDVSGEPVREVRMYFATGFSGGFRQNPLYDDGLHHDGEAGDGRFGGSLPAFPVETYVRYYVEVVAADSLGTASYLPRGAEHETFVYRVAPRTDATNPIRLNELMASNDTTVADETGSYPDWIELYNASDTTVDLSDYTLSDSPLDLDKWSFPAGTYLEARGYLLVWADKDPEDGPLHANFKLQAKGESLLLSDASGVLIDSVTYPEQVTDISYARSPDGYGEWGSRPATPHAANVLSSSNEENNPDDGDTDGPSTGDGEEDDDDGKDPDAGTPRPDRSGLTQTTNTSYHTDPQAVVVYHPAVDTTGSGVSSLAPTLAERALLAWPNPVAAGQPLTLRLPAGLQGEGSLKLVDQLGRTVYYERLSLRGSAGEEIRVALPRLPSGYYSALVETVSSQREVVPVLIR